MGNRKELDRMGQKILAQTRTELCLALPFMVPVLDALPCRMDLRTRSVGTDGSELLFHPHYLMTEFIEHPLSLRRCYLHMLFHCLFRQLYAAAAHSDAALWDLSSDIAAESVLDTIRSEAVQRLPSELREEWYCRLKERCGLLSAEKIYAYFEREPLTEEQRERLTREFHRCDHSFWDREGQKKPPAPRSASLPPRASAEDWRRRAKRVRTELETFGKEAGSGGEALEYILRLELKERPLYREFLERFAVLREVAEIDSDSFDYGFYHYGMERYGNMPLIEENEYSEQRRVEELVIAIDTSASCQAVLVQEFLNETATILSERESFFHKLRIRILECDERVRSDTALTELPELSRYAGQYTVHGGGGTDFRPVFRHVERLRERGELCSLKGLIYFTDGFGRFPERPTDYETAFVFRRDQDFADEKVPNWALRLYL